MKAVLSILVSLGLAATASVAEEEPDLVPPSRPQAVAVIREITSAIKTGNAKSVFKHFHRAPEWDKKRFEGQVYAYLEIFLKGEPELSSIEELMRDGIWGPAKGVVEKDRLRRRAALHHINPDACYALTMKDGRTEAVFHWEGSKLTIFHYDDEARRKALREYVLEGLENIRDSDKVGSGIVMSFFYIGQFGPDAEVAIPALSKYLTDDHAEMRIRAALAMWKIDRKSTVSLPPLLGVLTDKGMRVSARTMAVNCLWMIGPDAKSAAPALTAAMGEDDLKLRTFCAAALWKIVGDSDSTIPVLIESLKSEGLNVSSAAGRTLAEIISTLREDPGRKAVAEQLTRQLLEISTSKEVRIRIAAIKVLAQIGGETPSVSEALKKALKDENVMIRTSAARAIKDYDRKLQREGRKADDDPEKRARETNRKGSRAPRETNRKGSRAPRR